MPYWQSQASLLWLGINPACILFATLILRHSDLSQIVFAKSIRNIREAEAAKLIRSIVEMSFLTTARMNAADGHHGDLEQL
ncbi:hypothetical protein BST61_g9959 [Cercospora zeina]